MFKFFKLGILLTILSLTNNKLVQEQGAAVSGVKNSGANINGGKR